MLEIPKDTTYIARLSSSTHAYTQATRLCLTTYQLTYKLLYISAVNYK